MARPITSISANEKKVYRLWQEASSKKRIDKVIAEKMGRKADTIRGMLSRARRYFAQHMDTLVAEDESEYK